MLPGFGAGPLLQNPDYAQNPLKTSNGWLRQQQAKAASWLEHVNSYGAPVCRYFTTAAIDIRTYQIQCDRMIV